MPVYKYYKILIIYRSFDLLQKKKKVAMTFIIVLDKIWKNKNKRGIFNQILLEII